MKKSGIEMLRLLAMFLVVTLHVLGVGGILGAVEKGTLSYSLLWLMEVIAYVAVNLFALISGYVMWNKKMNYKKIASFFVLVYFYGIIIWFVTRMLGWHTATLSMMLSKSFPFNMGLWYVESYIGLMIFIPALNAFLQNMEECSLLGFAGMVFVMVSVLPLFLNRDIFHLNNGYSVLWLMILYLGGGVIAKCKIDMLLQRWRWLLYWAISVLLIWGTKLSVELINFKSYGTYEEYNVLISYVSPMMVVASICLFCVFSTITVTMPKWFYRISKCSFGVYLVHMHYLLLSRWISNKTVPYLKYPGEKMLGLVIMKILCVFAGTLLISFVIEELYGLIGKVISYCRKKWFV